jgi:regulator of protease activity HflC (stomatin/prohibitin superfamily)
VPPQEVITEDNVVVSVDAVVYYEPTDPQRLVYNVANFILAVTKLAQTNLRNVIGDMDLDAALTSRDQINLALRQILDDATDKWGVRVVRVEIQRIDPPPDVMSSMHEQMKAERTRRAVVLEADGAREASIARAEGEKRSAILQAEGVRESQVLQAEGEAQAIKAVAEAEQYRQQVVAQGQADAIRSVYQAIHDGQPTDDLIAIKYLETLSDIADGRATKIFLPAEMSGIMGSLGGVAELFNREPGPDGGSDGDGARPRRTNRPTPPVRVDTATPAPPPSGGSAPPAAPSTTPPPDALPPPPR